MGLRFLHFLVLFKRSDQCADFDLFSCILSFTSYIVIHMRFYNKCYEPTGKALAMEDYRGVLIVCGILRKV